MKVLKLKTLYIAFELQQEIVLILLLLMMHQPIILTMTQS